MKASTTFSSAMARTLLQAAGKTTKASLALALVKANSSQALFPSSVGSLTGKRSSESSTKNSQIIENPDSEQTNKSSKKTSAGRLQKSINSFLQKAAGKISNEFRKLSDNIHPDIKKQALESAVSAVKHSISTMKEAGEISKPLAQDLLSYPGFPGNLSRQDKQEIMGKIQSTKKQIQNITFKKLKEVLPEAIQKKIGDIGIKLAANAIGSVLSGEKELIKIIMNAENIQKTDAKAPDDDVIKEQFKVFEELGSKLSKQSHLNF